MVYHIYLQIIFIDYRLCIPLSVIIPYTTKLNLLQIKYELCFVLLQCFQYVNSYYMYGRKKGKQSAVVDGYFSIGIEMRHNSRRAMSSTIHYVEIHNDNTTINQKCLSYCKITGENILYIYNRDDQIWYVSKQISKTLHGKHTTTKASRLVLNAGTSFQLKQIDDVSSSINKSKQREEYRS